jgi:hypothetical protein
LACFCDVPICQKPQLLSWPLLIKQRWSGAFLAVSGPLMKLQKIEDQVYVESMADALKTGGFHLSRNVVD